MTSKHSTPGRRRFMRRAGTGLAGIVAAGITGSRNLHARPSESKYPGPYDWSMPKASRERREFDKVRSGRMVFLAYCMLNQNARILREADFPAMFVPLVEFLRDNHIGIAQMPCPEMRVLGLGRTSVRDGLETEEGHAHLGLIIDDLIYDIKEFRFQGFEVLGILGKNGSPSCGVTRTWLDNRQQDGEGVFIRLLRERLETEGLADAVPLLGVADHEQDKAIEWLKGRI